MNRRLALKLLVNSTLVAGTGAVGYYKVLPPSPSRDLDQADSLAKQLYASLSAADRAGACVAYDHPLRQYHNRGVAGGGISGWGFDRDQRQLLTDLFHAGWSEAGRRRGPEEQLIKWPGVHATNVLFCGDPHHPPYQLLLTGPHVNLRLGGVNREGVAFGGPQVYGDQRGNERQGLPGNLYRYQFETGHRLFASLSTTQQRAALFESGPIQTQIEVRGAGAAFRGVPVDAMSAESKLLARQLVHDILSNYPERDVGYAWQCIEANGGIEALHASYYREGEVDGSGQYQIFRLEGPGTVLYFRGYPHLHAFINIAMDAHAPLSVGESLGENPAPLTDAQVKALFERALQSHTGADLAHYDLDSVVGPLRAGTVRSGDIYNLESWQNRVAVIEMQGVDVREKLHRDVDPSRTYSVALTHHKARDLNLFGSRELGPMVRDVTVEFLKTNGFAGLVA